jgi:hypothetical protein
MSPTRKKVLATAVTVGATAIALTILLVPRAACACLTPSDMFGRVIGADMIGSSESELHAAILRRFPVGTPADEMEVATQIRDESGDPGLSACTRTRTAIRCHVDLGSSLFDVHRRDMDVELMLDEADRLAAVRVRKQRWLLGLPL